MSSARDFPENLCARCRRGALSPSEQEELERLLKGSAALELGYRVGLDFDRVATVQTGDEERVARFVAGALAERRTRRPRAWRPRHWSPWLVAAAVFGCCAVALGLRSAWWPKPTPSVVSATVEPPASAPRAHPHSARGQEVPDRASSASEPEVPGRGQPPTSTYPAIGESAAERSLRTAEPPDRAMDQPARPPPSAAFAAAEPVEPTAASLLQGANAARSRGQIEQAVSLLRELQQRFPGSPEATLSHVSLGKLLMLRGLSEAALREFSTYLTQGGPLEEEALVGRAQALGALGRLGEERGTWEALVTRFPNSVYAPRARERLGVLTGDAAR
jgi:hypothetical protein